MSSICNFINKYFSYLVTGAVVIHSLIRPIGFPEAFIVVTLLGIKAFGEYRKKALEDSKSVSQQQLEEKLIELDNKVTALSLKSGLRR